MFRLKQTSLEGCYIITYHKFIDQRGTTIKPFQMDSFDRLGLTSNFDEDIIVSSYKDVIRGLHFQKSPYEQEKLICVISGEILDVVVDLRVNSPTFGKFESFHLSENEPASLFIPKGFAQGYRVLTSKAVVYYKISGKYNPDYESGIYYNSMGIDWDVENPIVSDKDKKLPSFKEFVANCNLSFDTEVK